MNTNILKYAMLITKGTLVGFGAIMPGISGGTLCAAFGMYKPLLGLLSSPRKTIRDNGLDILAFLTGISFGFVGLSGLASWLMEKISKILICVFIGLIIGTIPGALGQCRRKRKKVIFIYIHGRQFFSDALHPGIF